MPSLEYGDAMGKVRCLFVGAFLFSIFCFLGKKRVCKIISPTNRNMSSIPRIGSKAQVFHGTARQTSGGLKKSDLIFKKGRIISRRKSAAGKKAIQHLFALGYKPKKGQFTLMRKSMAKRAASKRRDAKRKTRRAARK